MAYGSTDLDILAITTDEWVEANALDLFSSQNAFFAVLLNTSQEQMAGGFNFRQSDVAEGNQFKVTVYGNKNTTVQGVTRANQVNAYTPTVPGAGGAASIATNALWPWTHYQGIAYISYEDQAKNSGAAKMVDLGETIINQLNASFYDLAANDVWGLSNGSISNLQGIIPVLTNTGSPGGIDQTDTTNNSWWRAQTDTTAEVMNTQTFDQVRDACVFDTAKPTGITSLDPDCAFLQGNLYAKMRQDLKPAQRVEVSDMLKGGAKYLMYDGCRIFRETRMPTGTGVILNSGTWLFRYKTKAPDPNAPGFVVDPNRPAIKSRGYNWFVGLGCRSAKHNGYLANKAAA